jgi:hypothetical protein
MDQSTRGKLSQSFALDYLGGFEGDLEGLKLHDPFCHPPGDIGIAKNGLQGTISDHLNRVTLEVVA